jgi:hypothetical protein
MECHAYKYNEDTAEFDEVNDYNPRKQVLDDGPECKPRAAHVTAHGDHSILGQALVLTPATINGDTPVNGEVAPYSQVSINGQPSVLAEASVNHQHPANDRTTNYNGKATVNGGILVNDNASTNCQTCGN